MLWYHSHCDAAFVDDAIEMRQRVIAGATTADRWDTYIASGILSVPMHKIEDESLPSCSFR